MKVRCCRLSGFVQSDVSSASNPETTAKRSKSSLSERQHAIPSCEKDKYYKREISLRQERSECSCCEFMVAKIPGQRLNCYLFLVYRSPSMDERVFDCLCEAMGSIQSVDPKSVFFFVGDFNCHHSEWLGSHITDAHGVALLISPLLLTVLNWLMDPLIWREVCWILF